MQNMIFFSYLASILRNILKQFKEVIISVIPRRRTDLTVTSSTALMQYSRSSACISVLFPLYSLCNIMHQFKAIYQPSFMLRVILPVFTATESYTVPHRLHKMLNKLALGTAIELWLPSAVKAIRVRAFKHHLCICV